MNGAESTASPILRMEGVSKRYGGVRALANADLTVFAGRIHAILGENGAGKSTLIKILAGVVAPDAGRIVLDGAEVAFDSPAAANRAGIVCIFQELSLVPDLSVADNIAISNPPRRFGLIDRRAQRRLAEEALERAGATGHPSDGAGQGLAAVAPADGGDRQGAGAPASRPHSRRGDFGAHRRRCRQGVRRPQALAPGGARAPLHFAPHARDRGACRREHGVQERRQCRDLRGRDEDRQRGRRNDDRARVQPHLSAEAHGAPEGSDAAARGEESQLGGPAARHLIHRRRRRSRRPRRARRTGTAGIAAGVVRRPAWRFRRDPGGGRARFAFKPACGEGEAHRHGADPRGPQDGRVDAADVGARESLVRRASTRLEGRGDRSRARDRSSSASS